jgi:predicted Zn-dependent protease
VGRFHVSKRIEKEKTLSIARLAALFLSMVIPNPALSGAVLTTGMGGAQVASLKYSREDENEADSTGVAIAERAGYSGVGTAEFLKKLRLTGLEKTLPQYLLTHPYSDERIGRVEGLATTKKTSVDTSLFPFIIARMTIVDHPFGPEVEDQWARRYARNPEDPVNIYGMALVLTSKGNSEQAIKMVQTMNSRHKALFLGEIMVSARRWGDAIRTLENESNPIALYFLARAYEGAGDVAKAARTLEGLRSYADTYPEIYQRLGMVLGRQGNEAGGYENLGRYYLGTGKEQQARTSLEKAIAKYGLNSAKGQELIALLDSFKKEQPKK